MNRKSIVFTGPGKAELIEEELVAPKAGEVLVRLVRSCISSGTARANVTGVPDAGVGIFAQGEGVTPKFPYVRPEEGAATVKEALSVGCDEVVVCPGTYTLSEVVNVGRKVTLRGASSDREASVLYAPSVDGLRVMNLNHAEAIVSGIKLKGGNMTQNGNGGAVLNLTAGTVTNCVITENSIASDCNNPDLLYASGLYLTGGGVVTDSSPASAQI